MEMFLVILNYVCQVCRVNAVDIVEYIKCQPVTDARSILVYYLYRAGYSNKDIATMFLCYGKEDSYIPSVEEVNKKAKGLDKMRYAFADKIGQNYIFSLMAQDVLNFLVDKYGSMYQFGMKRLPSNPKL